MQIFARRKRTPGGVTLVEVVLVVVILVTVVALSFPVIQGIFEIRQLKYAGQSVVAEWNDARLQAMTEGRIYVFRFEPEGNRYTISPLPTVQDALEMGDIGTLRNPEALRPGMTFGETSSKLPDGIAFLALQNYEDQRAAMLSGDVLAQGVDVLAQDAQAAPQPLAPVLFYPDGTTSDTVLLLRDSSQRMIQVVLRGLTGTARVGEVLENGDLGAASDDSQDFDRIE